MVPSWSYLIPLSPFSQPERHLSKSLPHVNALAQKLINPSCECFQLRQGRQQNSNENPLYMVRDITLDKQLQSIRRHQLTFFRVGFVVLCSLTRLKMWLGQMKQNIACTVEWSWLVMLVAGIREETLHVISEKVASLNRCETKYLTYDFSCFSYLLSDQLT